MNDVARADLAAIQRDFAGSQAGNTTLGYPLIRFVEAIDYAVEVERRAEVLAVEVERLSSAIDTVLLRDGHFVFCTGGLENGCMPTCVALRAALSPERPAAKGAEE